MGRQKKKLAKGKGKKSDKSRGIQELPVELLEAIFAYLSPHEYFSVVKRVCRCFRDAVIDRQITVDLHFSISSNEIRIYEKPVYHRILSRRWKQVPGHHACFKISKVKYHRTDRLGCSNDDYESYQRVQEEKQASAAPATYSRIDLAFFDPHHGACGLPEEHDVISLMSLVDLRVVASSIANALGIRLVTFVTKHVRLILSEIHYWQTSWGPLKGFLSDLPRVRDASVTIKVWDGIPYGSILPDSISRLEVITADSIETDVHTNLSQLPNLKHLKLSLRWFDDEEENDSMSIEHLEPITECNRLETLTIASEWELDELENLQSFRYMWNNVLRMPTLKKFDVGSGGFEYPNELVFGSIISNDEKPFSPLQHLRVIQNPPIAFYACGICEHIRKLELLFRPMTQDLVDSLIEGLSCIPDLEELRLQIVGMNRLNRFGPWEYSRGEMGWSVDRWRKLAAQLIYKDLFKMLNIKVDRDYIIGDSDAGMGVCKTWRNVFRTALQDSKIRVFVGIQSKDKYEVTDGGDSDEDAEQEWSNDENDELKSESISDLPSSLWAAFSDAVRGIFSALFAAK